MRIVVPTLILVAILGRRLVVVFKLRIYRLKLNDFVHRQFESIESKINKGLMNTTELCYIVLNSLLDDI